MSNPGHIVLRIDGLGFLKALVRQEVVTDSIIQQIEHTQVGPRDSIDLV